MFDIIVKEMRDKHAQHSDRDLLYVVLANQYFIIQKLEAMGKQADILEASVGKLETSVGNIASGANPDALTNEEAQGFADRVDAVTGKIPQQPAPVEPAP